MKQKKFGLLSNKLSLLFVTGNANKIKEFRSITADVLDVQQIHIDLPEYQGDAEQVAIEKCRHAFKEVGKPLITEDTSLCFNAYGGLPGPYIKWFMKKIHPEGLYKMAKAFDDRSAYAQCIFSYIENGETEPKQFIGKCNGTIVEPRGPENFGWDSCFQPDGYEQTYAEMSPEVKNSISHRGRALKE